jgi:hypothetical protein
MEFQSLNCLGLPSRAADGWAGVGVDDRLSDVLKRAATRSPELFARHDFKLRGDREWRVSSYR